MLIGIFGDSHDHMKNIGKAVEKFNRERIDIAIHTGDYISPFVIPVIGKLTSPVIGVYGNNDGDKAALQARCPEFPGIRINGNYTQIDPDGLKIALIHGHDTALLQDLIVSGYLRSRRTRAYPHGGPVPQGRDTGDQSRGIMRGYHKKTDRCFFRYTLPGGPDRGIVKPGKTGAPGLPRELTQFKHFSGNGKIEMVFGV
jgi:putative phosphoesterase